MSDAVAVDVFDVAKHFPIARGFFGRRGAHVRAVDGLTFHIAAGGTFGLVGESGCGETTVAMLLAKLLEPTAASVW